MNSIRFALPLTLICGLTSICFAPENATAADWPQILGPSRSGVSEDTKLPDHWPDEGPKQLWEQTIGEGFAGPAIANNRVFLFHRIGADEIVDCLDLESGKQIWRSTFPASYQGRIEPDGGPRCVPLVHDQSVYLFGPSGDLRCLSVEDGEEIWSRNIHDEFRAGEGYFGAGSSPIVSGDKLLLNVGGRLEDSCIVAFHLKDGSVAWQSGNDEASYSSPIEIQFDGKSAVLFVTRLHATIVDPDSGKQLAQIDFGARGPTVNAASPLFCDGNLFLTASYRVGGQMLQPIDGKLKTVWKNDTSLSSQYTTSIFYDGRLYGTHGREDTRVGHLRCVDAETGKILWNEQDFGLAHVIRADNKMLLQLIDGELVLAELTPDEFKPLSRASLFEGKARALPALSRGMLVTRSNAERGKGLVRCFQVGSAKSE